MSDSTGCCTKCHKPRYLVNMRYGLCNSCNRERLILRRQERDDLNDGEPEKKEKSRHIQNKAHPKRKLRKPTGELIVFKMILLERGAKSQISGEFISHPAPINFLHLLPKSHYGKFRLRKDNIIIGTSEEHRLYDCTSIEELKKLPEWKWVFEKVQLLKEEYNRLYK